MVVRTTVTVPPLASLSFKHEPLPVRPPPPLTKPRHRCSSFECAYCLIVWGIEIQPIDWYMAASSRILSLLLLLLLMFPLSSANSTSRTCNRSPPSETFLHHLHFTCPLQNSPSLPLEMDGDSLERVLSSTLKNVQTVVLFYDSKSPFSSIIRSKYDILSSMFPQLGHLAVEQSSVMPSLFSRYGIHSLPALFILNQTAQIRYSGPKDLHSLIHFYRRTTALDPAECWANSNDLINGQTVYQPWYQLLWLEVIVKEPFLVFAILFVVLRASIYFCPGVLSRIMALWIMCKRQFSLGILGESSQLLGRVLHLIDIKRVGCKLKLYKTRNFQKGARSARVWASSLASVSLGETSSARPSSSVDS